MLLILLGKTCSGKTTIANELKKYGFHPIVTYTTRPIRGDEIEDITYHFISEDEFRKKIQEGFFLEYKSYKTVEGTWLYGSAKDDYINSKDNRVIILTPEGYKDFLEKYPNESHRSAYIYANNSSIKKRLLSRGDKKEEAERRLEHDNRAFKGVEFLAGKIIYNNERNQLPDVINKILEYMEVG